MPKINDVGSQPKNTDALGKGIDPKQVKGYWFDNQIYTDGEYVGKELPKNVPMHLPYVCRFVYGYDPSDLPDENGWSGCGCPGTGNCDSIYCEWVMERFNRIGFGLRWTPDGFAASHPINGNFTVTPPDSSFVNTYWFDSYMDSQELVIYDDIVNMNEIYRGDYRSCPTALATGWWLFSRKWTKNCYIKVDGVPDFDQPTTLEGCPTTYDEVFVSQESNPDPLCTRIVRPTVNLFPSASIPAVWFGAIDTGVDVTQSDYPPYYDTGCTPGPGPCP